MGYPRGLGLEALTPEENLAPKPPPPPADSLDFKALEQREAALRGLRNQTNFPPTVIDRAGAEPDFLNLQNEKKMPRPLTPESPAVDPLWLDLLFLRAVGLGSRVLRGCGEGGGGKEHGA